MPEVSMPRLSDTMQEGTITRWLKKPGDEVKRGDIVAEVETDKANMEIEAYDSGILQEILVQEGETAPIGQAIATIGDGKSALKQQSAPAASSASNGAQKPAAESQSRELANAQTAANQRQTSGETTAPTPAAANNQHVQNEQAATTSDGARAKVSPLARRMAEEHGIELSQVTGSGPGGRIVRDDIEDFLAQRTQSAPAAPQQQQPSQPTQPVQAAQPVVAGDAKNLSSMQKTIARRLTESKQNVPHFYVRNDVDMTDALTLRKLLNESVAEGDAKISVNDLIIKASALALEKFPEANGSYRDGQFIYHKQVNIGIAVDIAGGLVVPVLRDANVKGVRTIAREAKALIDKAKAGKLTAEDLSGGTFSISNLGMMDVTEFSAVINPPEAAILAVGAARKTFVPVDNQPVIRDIMALTLSADHRILYGATVARFLQEIKRLLQQPYSLLG